MELKSKLNKPYTEKQRVEFVVFQNHILGYEIKETEGALEAWGKTEEEKQQEEQTRIANLQVTKRVFALGLQQLGITYTQLKELIATNEQAQMEWDLCVELQRKNPLLDIMGEKLGISHEQIDNIFVKANDELVNEEV